MPTKSNWPSNLLSAASSRSPWKTPDCDCRLVVLGGREGLAAFGGDLGCLLLAFLHELAEPLTAIACHTGVARRLRASDRPDSAAEIAGSLEQISLEIMRATDVIKRFRSYIQKEAKQQLDSIEKTGDTPAILSRD
jgi:hypothetical protein